MPKKQSRGQFYFSWGYNRDWYSNSTIRFVNNNPDPIKSYDFTLYYATAQDQPDMEKYWDIDRLTIPYFDLTLGYHFKGNNNQGFELGGIN